MAGGHSRRNVWLDLEEALLSDLHVCPCEGRLPGLPVPDLQLPRGFSLDDAHRRCAHVTAKLHYVVS
ncbi:hypothetical protein M513_11472 [Trichuris suis]|uniref:Uncharacterized protein n=1 Tax=Trichuris suis TaxID=68888 RepID=A0A085LRT5_9BILA|nr:hypothetical protein M513_11472 [Trichuris suis]